MSKPEEFPYETKLVNLANSNPYQLMILNLMRANLKTEKFEQKYYLD